MHAHRRDREEIDQHDWPEELAERSVPWRWMANRLTRMASAIHTIYGSKALLTTPSPSTAEITEIAGVSIHRHRTMLSRTARQ